MVRTITCNKTIWERILSTKNPAIIKPISSIKYNSIAKGLLYSLLDNVDTIEKLEIKTNHWLENLRNIIENITF